MDDRIEDAKARLKARITAGTAKGINGVGIDRDLDKLVVFYVDHDKALDTLEVVCPGFAEFSIMEDGSPPEEDERVGENPVVLEKLPLSPSLVIKSAEDGEGLIGCFVQSDGLPAVLTVAHIFPLQEVEKPVYVRKSEPGNFVLIGKTYRFTNLRPPTGQRNLADGALFLPDMDQATLERDARIQGDYFDSAGLAGIEKKRALSLTSRLEGKVHDSTALIAYDVVIAGKPYKNVVFDQQVLVKNVADDELFGQKFHSGSLVVKAGTPDKGKALGLYSYTTKNRKYHYVTPFFACADELRIDSIFNPKVVV